MFGCVQGEMLKSTVYEYDEFFYYPLMKKSTEVVFIFGDVDRYICRKILTQNRTHLRKYSTT